MDISAATAYLLKNYNLKPDRSRGQNFLISEKVYDQIIAAADITPNDTVLEIGPGLGFLTSKLLDKAKKVIAVESDRRLLPILENIKLVSPHLEIVNQDILQFPTENLPIGYKLVGNIPYYITGKIIKQFITVMNPPSKMVFLLQREVAERICAIAGSHSLLSLSVQYYGTPQIKGRVNAGKFFPKPKVDSAIIAIELDEPRDKNEEKKFWQLARIGFASKRKTLAHNLAAGLKIDKQEIAEIFTKLNFKPKVRAQELTLRQWKELVKILNN